MGTAPPGWRNSWTSSGARSALLRLYGRMLPRCPGVASSWLGSTLCDYVEMPWAIQSVLLCLRLQTMFALAGQLADSCMFPDVQWARQLREFNNSPLGKFVWTGVFVSASPRTCPVP